MKIVVYRVPLIDGVVQSTPMTYFKKHTSAGIPFFSKHEKDAMQFDDYDDPKVRVLVDQLSRATCWDWGYLEKVDERAA
jgi:hypothetical protein